MTSSLNLKKPYSVTRTHARTRESQKKKPAPQNRRELQILLRFVKDSKKYITEQILLDILNIDIIDIRKKR